MFARAGCGGGEFALAGAAPNAYSTITRTASVSSTLQFATSEAHGSLIRADRIFGRSRRRYAGCRASARPRHVPATADSLFGTRACTRTLVACAADGNRGAQRNGLRHAFGAGHGADFIGLRVILAGRQMRQRFGGAVLAVARRNGGAGLAGAFAPCGLGILLGGERRELLGELGFHGRRSSSLALTARNEDQA